MFKFEAYMGLTRLYNRAWLQARRLDFNDDDDDDGAGGRTGPVLLRRAQLHLSTF